MKRFIIKTGWNSAV